MPSSAPSPPSTRPTCDRTSASSTTSSVGAPATGTCRSAAWGPSPTPLRPQRSRRAQPSSPGADVTSADPSTGEVVWAGAGGGGSAVGSTIVAGCAPMVLNRLLVAAGADPVDTEPDVEGAQLKVNMLLTRLPRLRDSSGRPHGRLRRHLPHQRGLRPARAVVCRRPRRAHPRPPAVRDLLPHPVGPLDPRGRPRRERRPDAHALRSAPAGPALPRRQRPGDQAGSGGDPALPRLRSGRADRAGARP